MCYLKKANITATSVITKISQRTMRTGSFNAKRTPIIAPSVFPAAYAMPTPHQICPCTMKIRKAAVVKPMVQSSLSALLRIIS